MNALLEVRDLSLSYGGVHAVDNVSLDVEEGSIVGLIGPNGAGKTTLFECIGGFVRPDSGHVRFSGREVTRAKPEKRARSGLIRSFQDARLFPSLTVFESIMVSLERHAPSRLLDSTFSLPTERRRERKKTARVDELIAAMSLGPYRDRLIREISTGTKRITELACMIALGPKLLLLDEPSAGIAQKETEALGPLLRRIRQMTDTTMFIIEHDMPLIMGLAETIIALESGALVAVGTPAEIQRHPHVIASYLGSKGQAPKASEETGVTEVIAKPRPARKPRQTQGIPSSNGRKTEGTRVSDGGRVTTGCKTARCQAVTSSGKRCSRPAVAGAAYCALPAHRKLAER